MNRLLHTAASLALLAWALPATAQTGMAPTNKLDTGGFEADTPSYWTASGDGAVWSTERSRSPNYSLKLSGSGAASWTQAEIVRNWVNGFDPDKALTMGAFVWTEGVNTSPSTDAEKFQMVVTFRDADGANVLGQDVVLDLPQAAASTGGWTKVSTESLGVITLPKRATSATVTVRKGASATGTVYVDDFFVNGTGGLFNATVDVPGGEDAGWYYYIPGAGSGAEGWPESQPFFQTKTTAEAHSGNASLLIRENVANPGNESVGITERVPVTPGVPVLISYWLKTEGNQSPNDIGTGDNNVGITALWYSSLASGAAGYNEIGGIDIRLNGEYNNQVIPLLPRQAANGWTQYAFVVYPPAATTDKPAAAAMEVRLRYWHAFSGATYWDDVFIGDVPDVTAALPNLVSASGFESDSPSYWMAEGDGAEWTNSEARSPNYSLKLSGAGEASWTQAEIVRNWVSGFKANEALTFGAFVKTEGVNTSPSTDAEKFQMVVSLRDADGNNLTGGDIVLDLPQAAASTDGWVKVSTESLGAISLPKDAKSATVTVRKGASATGAVYVDDFFALGGGGGLFNATVDVPGGWYYYVPGAGSGAEGWPDNQPFFLTKTTEEAHTGDASLRIEENVANPENESVAITERVPATPGQPMLVSYWLKTEGNESPSTIGQNDNNVGITALWYSSLASGAAGYNEIGGADIRLNGEYNRGVIPLLPQQADNGWTNYAFVLYPPAATTDKPAAAAMEVRLRYWHAFTGATYWDDVAITNVGGSLFATAGEDGPGGPLEPRAGRWLLPNAPNPFGASTEVRFALPAAAEVTLEVYDMLGRRVALLADGERLAADAHARTLSADGLPSGNYLVVLRTPDHAEARTITVVR